MLPSDMPLKIALQPWFSGLVKMVSLLAFPYFLGGCASFSSSSDEKPSPLHDAAEAGNLHRVKSLLAKGIALDSRDILKRQVIHSAAESGNLELVQYLVAKGADVRSRDGSNHTPLHLAAGNGHEKIVGYLLDQGAKVDDVENSGNTALHKAANCGDLETVKLLVERGAKVRQASEYGPGGWMPIHHAATSDSVPTVEYLLKHGAKVNDLTSNQVTTPLQLSLMFGGTDVVRYLVKHGANVSPVHEHEGAAIHIAAGERGDLSLVQLLVSHGSKVNAFDNEGQLPIHLAAREARVDIVKWLILHGSPVNKPSAISTAGGCNCSSSGGETVYGAETPLHVANGNTEIVKLLLENGASANVKNYKRHTPLMYSLGNPESVKLLLEHGANPKTATRDGQTALHWACESSANVDSIKFLLDYKADPNAVDNHGDSPLHLACDKGKLEVSKLLLSRGAVIDKRDASGRTPLARAAVNGNYPELVDFLLERGADVNAVDHNGNSIVGLCSKEPILNKLLNHGAKINNKNNEGNAPAEEAVRNNKANVDIRNYILSYMKPKGFKKH
jgi:ankyrin repeat protein